MSETLHANLVLYGSLTGLRGAALHTAVLLSGGIEILGIWLFLGMLVGKKSQVIIMYCVSAAGLLQDRRGGTGENQAALGADGVWWTCYFRQVCEVDILPKLALPGAGSPLQLHSVWHSHNWISN